MMPRREKINNVNAVKIMTNSLGHYNTFATLSATTNSPTFSIFIRPYAREKNIWLPFAEMQGKPLCFLPAC